MLADRIPNRLQPPAKFSYSIHICLSFVDFKLEKVMVRFSVDHFKCVHLNIFQLERKVTSHILHFYELGKDGGDHFGSQACLLRGIFYPGLQ